MNVYKMTILGNEYYSKRVVFFKNMFIVKILDFVLLTSLKLSYWILLY